MIPRTERRPEVAKKLQRLRDRMAVHEIDVIRLTQLPNLMWLTAGASLHINLASDVGPTAILITADQAYVLTDNIEAPRLEQEESLPALGFAMMVESWSEPGGHVQSLASGKRMGQDGPGAGVDLSTELQALRANLQDEELARLRFTGALAGAAIGEVIDAIHPGMNEREIARNLTLASQVRGGDAIVNLVASDERITAFRHPLPADKAVARYVMVVLCLRYEGLIAAVTRFVHFGPLPDDLIARAQSVARIDTRMMLGTRVGKTLGDMYALATQAYADEGYPEEILAHHQGGSIAYQPREILIRPHDPTRIAVGQAFAWNPRSRMPRSRTR